MTKTKTKHIRPKTAEPASEKEQQCPVARIAIEAEAVIAALMAEDHKGKDRCPSLHDRLHNRLHTLCQNASYLQALSTHGALFHVLITCSYLDMVNNTPLPIYDRDVEDMCHRCLLSTARFFESLGACLPEARNYFGDDRFDPGVRIAEAVQKVAKHVAALNPTLRYAGDIPKSYKADVIELPAIPAT
jgi:hypothetical protein